MTLKTLKDFLKVNLTFDGDFYIGKIDKNKDKAICLYNNTATPKTSCIGGKSQCSYILNSIQLLLRYTGNADIAEQKADNIQAFFDEQTFTIDGHRVFVISRYDCPIGLGTDDKGIYEYSFMFDFYQNKE